MECRPASEKTLSIPILADVNCSVAKAYGFHWLLRTLFTRAIGNVDAKGIIHPPCIMLRAFYPTDRSVITSILRGTRR